MANTFTGTHTVKIGNTEVTVEFVESAKAGLKGITLNGNRVDNFRTTKLGYRLGSNTQLPDSHPEKYIALSTTPKALAELVARKHMEAKITKAEAKAEAKAKAEVAKAEAKIAKAEAKATGAKTTTKARTVKVTTKA